MYRNTLLTLVTIVTAVLGQKSMIPLSSNEYSYTRGNPSSSIVVEMYIDLACSATMDAWPTLNEVVDAYSNDVFFEYHVFPLPYHQQAFILSKAASTVNYFGDSASSVFTYMDTTFANQAEIYNSATADMTYTEVVELVKGWATNGTGVTDEEYAIGMDSNTDEGHDLEMATRYMWKFATLHHINGTPLYSINGLEVMGLSTFAEWAYTLDPLIEAARLRKKAGRDL